MVKRFVLVLMATTLVASGFAFGQGRYRQEPPQPVAEARAPALRQSKLQREQRVETEKRIATQSHRQRLAMDQECEDGEPAAVARQTRRGPQARW